MPLLIVLSRLTKNTTKSFKIIRFRHSCLQFTFYSLIAPCFRYVFFFFTFKWFFSFFLFSFSFKSVFYNGFFPSIFLSITEYRSAIHLILCERVSATNSSFKFSMQKKLKHKKIHKWIQTQRIISLFITISEDVVVHLLLFFQIDWWVFCSIWIFWQMEIFYWLRFFGSLNKIKVFIDYAIQAGYIVTFCFYLVGIWWFVSIKITVSKSLRYATDLGKRWLKQKFACSVAPRTCLYTVYS